ncbi:MAG TPA: response regulator [Acidimicrobiales bacterium]
MGVSALVVDDSSMMRELLKHMLGELGIADTYFEDDPVMIIDEVRRSNPDLILLDLHLRGSNGLKVAQCLSEEDPEWGRRAILFVTGDAVGPELQEALTHGIRDVLQKPFTVGELDDKLEELLARVRQSVGPDGANSQTENPASASSPRRPEVSSEADFKTLFESAPGLYLVLDPEYVIVTASDAYLKATMTERDTIVGRDLFDVFPDNPDDPNADGVTNLRRSLDRVKRTRAPDTMAVQKYDIRRPASEGGKFEVRYWSPLNSPVLGPNRELLYIIHRAVDVTDFVRLKESESKQKQLSADLQDRTAQMEMEIVRRAVELQETNRKLEAANAAKSEFLSRVSHELRTPLTSILGFGELLSMSDLPLEQEESVELILTAGRHLLALLDDVLDIARIDSGQMSLSVEPVSIDTVITDAFELARPLAASRGITINRDHESKKRGYVNADYQRLRQVLLNLLSNGIKYNRRAGMVTITVEDRPDDFVRVSITDTGAGISAEDLSRLFVPFERLAAIKTSVEGTGLGLVLSRNLTEGMGGRLGVSSTPDVGSTFWVELPSVEPRSVEELRPEIATRVQSRRYSRPRKLVYVEDMLANVKLVEQILLRRPDVTVVPAMLGIVAIDLVRNAQPDLVMLDLHLPDMGGDEVLRRLKSEESTRDIPVVILSADATKRRHDELIEEGAIDYLTKPIGVKYLLDAIDHLFGEDTL